jgi:hypothetical protein
MITKNHLPEDIFKQLRDFCEKTDFKIIDIGAGRQISVLETPYFVLPHIQLDGNLLVQSFLRESYDGFDNNLNIHADTQMNGINITTASVLYVNNPKGVSENGTAFYSHKEYGEFLPEVSNIEHDRLLHEDANNPDKWDLKFMEPSEPNKFLTYNAKHFHAKYPANINKGCRIVLVSFYTKYNGKILFKSNN